MCKLCEIQIDTAWPIINAPSQLQPHHLNYLKYSISAEIPMSWQVSLNMIYGNYYETKIIKSNVLDYVFMFQCLICGSCAVKFMHRCKFLRSGWKIFHRYAEWNKSGGNMYTRDEFPGDKTLSFFQFHTCVTWWTVWSLTLHTTWQWHEWCLN